MDGIYHGGLNFPIDRSIDRLDLCSFFLSLGFENVVVRVL